MCTISGAFGGLLEVIREQIVELDGSRGPFGTGKSSCMCRVATISFIWPFLAGSRAALGKKKADFGPKMQIFKWRSGTCDACSRPPPLSS